MSMNTRPSVPTLAVEVGRLGALQIGEEAPDPRREMRLEHLAIGASRRRKAAARKPRHDLAEDRGVILRLGLAVGAFDAELRQDARAAAPAAARAGTR